MKTSIIKIVAALFIAFNVSAVQAKHKITYLHTDALGSTIAATDENGDLEWTQNYRPYGSRYDIGDTSETPKTYTGHVEDTESGLVYMQARYYNPTMGRFMAMDPVTFYEESFHSFNRYAYGRNNPYKFIDPDGRDPGDLFGSAADTAKDFGKIYNDDSIRNNVEYFSAIYSQTNAAGVKQYSYNIPNKGGPAGVAMDLNVNVGQTLESTVHAHAAYDPGFQNNIPSPGDFGTMIGVSNEFVSTPNGSLIEYNIAGRYNTIAIDMPSDKKDPGRLNKNGVGWSFFGWFDDDAK